MVETTAATAVGATASHNRKTSAQGDRRRGTAIPALTGMVASPAQAS